MRPSGTTPEEPRFECPSCGDRASSVDGRRCEACGSELRNVAKSRDL